MKLSAALLEFSDLLDVSACALQAMIRAEPTATDGTPLQQIEEVTQLAERLRVISKQLERRAPLS